VRYINIMFILLLHWLLYTKHNKYLYRCCHPWMLILSVRLWSFQLPLFWVFFGLNLGYEPKL